MRAIGHDRSRQMLTLHGKTAILTGATGTIGQEIARLLLALGCKLVLADVDEQRLSNFADDIRDHGPVCIQLYDNASPEAATAVVERAVAEYGQLDCLVTAAGMLRRTPFAEIATDEFALITSVNYQSVFRLCQAALPRIANGGAIVNLASLSAHTGRGQGAHYAAAKAAVVALTKSLADEYAPRLRANCVSPGFVESPLSRPVLDGFGADLIERIPARRLGTAREIAQAVAFLCSDWSSYITGQTLHVNGGLYKPG
jgi:3-oxoacyl-[acyl-carrier protein] reductase